jgi:hypothetical protein
MMLDVVEPKMTPRDLWRPIRALPQRMSDVLAVTCYLIGAVWVTAHLWVNPSHRTVGRSGSRDQVFFEWTLSHAQWSVTHLSNPLFTERLNVPDGVNMMANTSILGLAIPLTPVTAAFGPGVSFALLLTIGFAATAAAWYWLFSRHLVRSRLAAFIGAAFCGFAPGMVSQGTGHPNFVAQFLVPFIVWRVMRLRDPGRVLRNGLVLGLLVTYQMFINEEMVFFTAIGCAVFLLAYCLPRWKQVRGSLRPFLAGLGVAALTAGVLMAYPLWFQFFGPQHYRGIPYGAFYYSPSIDSFVGYATESLAGNERLAAKLAPNASEQSAFFGWPLVLLCGVLVWWRRKRPLVPAIAITGVFFAALSLGPNLIVKGVRTGIPAPLSLLSKLPVFDMVVPARLALPVIPVIGLLLALGIERVRDVLANDRTTATFVRPLWYGLLAASLVPIMPTPIASVAAPAVPAFISDGVWREYVQPGRSLVSVPIPRYESIDAMGWAASCELCVTLPGGYFVGPSSPGGVGRVGSPPRPTATLLARVASTGIVPDINDDDRRQALADLDFWQADTVVLGRQKREWELRVTVEMLLGPAKRVSGVWLWDVRHLSQGPDKALRPPVDPGD